jgi:hypothetical protein
MQDDDSVFHLMVTTPNVEKRRNELWLHFKDIDNQAHKLKNVAELLVGVYRNISNELRRKTTIKVTL